MEVEKLKLELQEYFSDLQFREEEHIYSVDGADLSLSVSGMIKKYKYPTNWDFIIRRVAYKRALFVDELQAEWDEAARIGCERGTKAHLFGEKYVYDRTLKPETGMDEAIVKFWNDLPDYVIPLSIELKMYHKKYMFAGTGDILLYNTKTRKVIICDYKTNKELFKTFGKQKMTRGFSDLLCCNFNHYQLQLSYYQILLEQVLTPLGIEVSGRKIIWLKEEGVYELYDTDDYTEELKLDLELIGVC